jgi:hypothetical protein
LRSHAFFCWAARLAKENLGALSLDTDADDEYFLSVLKWILFIFVAAGVTPWTRAETLSFSGEEVEYTYEAHFRSLVPAVEAMDRGRSLQWAKEHAEHLFGLFHTAEYAEQIGYHKELIEGFAGTKKPKILNVRSYREPGDEFVWIHYQAQSRMLVLNKVLESWTGKYQEARVPLPLLSDLPGIYKDSEMNDYRLSKWKKCTDEHYSGPSDFSYFYNPYRCPELSRAPLAEIVNFQVKRLNSSDDLGSLDFLNSTKNFPAKELRSENSNGRLTTFYFANGFDEMPESGTGSHTIRQDSGWKNFVALEKLLIRNYGFEKIDDLTQLRRVLGEDMQHLDLQTPVALNHVLQRRYFSTFVRVLGSGEKWVVRSALFNTQNESGRSATRSFPLFWKEAWENGDFIYFGGHSGDGQSLNLRTMLDTLKSEEVEGLRVPFGKTQVALLDACSSYDHYEEMYRRLNPSGLHLMTYGLVSLFHLAPATMEALLDLTLKNEKTVSWFDALRHIEEKQLQPHVEFLYDKKDQVEMLDYFGRREAFPSFLLNVTLPIL